MEQRINVAELLKDCPKGMELDCTMYNSVSLISVDDREGGIFPIRVLREDGSYITLTKYGQYTDEDFAKCVIFPKGKTTWEGFVTPCKFKDGDVIYNEDINAVAIFNKQTDMNTISHCFLNILGELRICHYHIKDLSNWRLATEEEKQKLFDAIKENGYKWNAKTKTLEELKEYPKTYKECLERTSYDKEEIILHLYLLENFKQLLICRNVYWKIAGEEMGLGKPWEPDWNDLNRKYFISLTCEGISLYNDFRNPQILAFPTKEMRDAFYENFKNEIEQCKELL